MLPLMLKNVIVVPYIDNLDLLSNYGLSVDVVASGVHILSTILEIYYISRGTSMAAPHVSGIAALMLFNNKKIQIKDIKGT